MAKFRKKPIEVEAFRLVDQEVIVTLEGTMIGNPGDWLITGVAGERYPCKHEIFLQTYEPADNCKCPGGSPHAPGPTRKMVVGARETVIQYAGFCGGKQANSW